MGSLMHISKAILLGGGCSLAVTSALGEGLAPRSSGVSKLVPLTSVTADLDVAVGSNTILSSHLHRRASKQPYDDAVISRALTANAALRAIDKEPPPQFFALDLYLEITPSTEEKVTSGACRVGNGTKSEKSGDC